MTFRDAAEAVMRRMERRWKPRTRKTKWSTLRTVVMPAFGHVQDVRSITPVMIRRWHASTRSRPHAGVQGLALMSVIMTECEASGWRDLDSNPCRGVRRHRLQGRDRRLDADEYRRLGRALDRLPSVSKVDSSPADYCDLFRFVALTGARIGEALGMIWSMVDLRAMTVSLPDSKSGPRTVWLSEPSAAILRRRFGGGRAPRQLVFDRAKWPGRPISHSQYHRHWRRVCQLAGLEDVRVHDLRHAFASVAMDLGHPVTTVGRLLGAISCARTAAGDGQ